MLTTRVIKLLAVGILAAGLFPTSVSADMMQSFHARVDGTLQMWRTIDGDRVTTQPFFFSTVRACFIQKWTDVGNKDRDIEFRPLNSANSFQREAFFNDGVMADWDVFWDAQPTSIVFEWPVLSDPDDLIDIYAGVDLTVWTASPVPFSLVFGNIIPIVNGRNDELLPGYLLSTSPITYTPGIGWVTSQPLNGNVVVQATRDGQSIPEPTTMLLFGTGLAGVAIKTRKRLKGRKSRKDSTTDGSIGL